MKSLFDNLRAIFTSLGSSERQELEALWEQNGGKVVASVTPNDPPHVVITRRVGSSKYVSLMRRHPNTHVVPPEWIRKSVEMKKKQPYSQFQVGALYGLKICLSGFDVDKKAELAEIIARNGGTHSPSLTKFCTHLVSTDRTSQKYVFAVKHGIVCCSLDWLLESTKGKVLWCRDAAKYHVKDKEMSLMITRADTCDADTFAGASKRTNANTNTNTNICDEVVNEGVRGKKVEERKKVQERKMNERTQGGNDKNGDDKYNNEGERQQDNNDIDNEIDNQDSLDTDRSFLRDCGIWHVGLSSTELKELVSLCCKSGATRINFSHPTLVTHIVRGSEPCKQDEREQIKKALQSHLNPPHLVNMDWLRACVSSGQEIDANQVRFQPSKEEDSLTRLASGRIYNNSKSNGTLDRLESGRSIQGLNQNANDTNDASNSSISGIFSGYFFTLCAVRGTSEEQLAEVLIRQHGGKINNSSVPTTGDGTLLAICPASLTRIEASKLRAQSNYNFASVPEDNRFTLYWIRCCVSARKMLGHQEGAPCFRPLPYDIPMEGMQKVSISTSGYDEDVKSAIKFTVETIGGRFSAKNMSAKDTHLIVPFAHGEKYRHSERLGVTPVTAQWLVESVKSGRILDVARFRPGPKPGCEPDTMAPGNPTGNVETTQHAWNVGTGTLERAPLDRLQPAKKPRPNEQMAGNSAPREPDTSTANARSTSKPANKRPKEPIAGPKTDDLSKAGMQVSSLISRLKTAGGNVVGARAALAPTDDDHPAKDGTARPLKRGSSSRRVGLHQSGKPSIGNQSQGDNVFEMEVSQRVGYLGHE